MTDVCCDIDGLTWFCPVPITVCKHLHTVLCQNTKWKREIFIYLFLFYYHFAIQAKYIHKIKKYQASEPKEANKAN